MTLINKKMATTATAHGRRLLRAALATVATMMALGLQAQATPQNKQAARQNKQAARQNNQTSRDSDKGQFPYPTVPETMRTVAERAEYVVTHYWDGFDFSDTTLIHKPDVTEQGFANFVDLLPRVDSALAVRGTHAFAQRAFGQGTPARVREYFAKQVDHYLYDPQSPLRNDYTYIMFAREMKDMPALGVAERERCAFRLRNVAKNMPGEVAADFRFIDRKGNVGTLHGVKARLTVVYFNDPDCDNCHRITKTLLADSLMAKGGEGIRVLAVYPDADTEEWKRRPQPFPAWWTDAYSPDGEITAQGIYFIRATPTIYLLDENKRVMLKDPTAEGLISFLRKISPHPTSPRGGAK